MCASLAVTWSLLTGRVTQFRCVSLSGGSTRHYPRFRIRRPSFERRGDFNPHDSRAAQRTLRLDPSSCRPNLPPPVFPRRASPPVTYGSGWQDFSGSHDFLVHMIWSPTPAVRRLLAMSATAVLPSAI